MSASEGTVQPTRSVVICTYAFERLPLLLAAIDSVRGQRPQAPEIVVVIDGNAELLASLREQCPDVRVVANEGPRGLSSARNTGIGAASGQRIAFLDDDAVAEPDWLAHLETAFADPSVLVAGGHVVPAWATERPAWFPEEFDWVVGCSYRGQTGDGAAADGAPVPVRNVIGASMLFRREVFEAVGGFHTGLGRIGTVPVGGEETELCIRTAAHFGSGRVVYVPRAVVHHHVPASRATLDYFVRRCRAEGLSKAVLAKLAGRRDGLSSEARHLTQALPRAVLRELGAALRGDLQGLRRAAVLLVGTWSTGVGWLVGTFGSKTSVTS